jgi:hypothetical protein
MITIYWALAQKKAANDVAALTLEVSQNIWMEQPGQAIPTEGFHE